MNGYNSGGSHTISGKLNAGGTPLAIQPGMECHCRGALKQASGI